MQEGLTALRDRCNRDSTALIFMSCHGHTNVTLEDGVEKTTFFLLPRDARMCNYNQTGGKKRVEVDPQTALSGEAFQRLIQAIPAKNKMVVIDACHSGGMGQVSNVEDEMRKQLGADDEKSKT